MPNERSSHVRPTPHAGGLAIALATLGALAMLCLLSLARPSTGGLWPLAAATVLAATGWIDDRRELGRLSRLSIQIVAVAALLTGIAMALSANPVTGPGASPLTGLSPLVTGAAAATLIVGAVWWINLFNFMDGIDGIAASQALFMLLGAAALMTLESPGAVERATSAHALSPLGWACVAATAGFLTLNWAPARLFMGDVGSLFIGYVVLVEAVASIAAERLSVWVWLILGALFIADATVTLLHRLVTGQRFADPHRSHAYQRLARFWASHARVTIAYGGVNLFVLLPLAGWATIQPGAAPWIAGATLVALGMAAAWLGAGRPGELRMSRDGVRRFAGESRASEPERTK